MIYGSSNFFYPAQGQLICSKFVSRVILSCQKSVFMLLLKRPACYNTRVVKRATSLFTSFCCTVAKQNTTVW